MKLEKRELLRKALPRNFRIKWVPADLEGPGEMIWRICPPDYNFVQRATRKGFLGFFRCWETVGELDAEEDAIFLREEYYDELAGFIRTVLATYGIMASVEQGVPRSTLRYLGRLQREPSILAGFRLARVMLSKGISDELPGEGNEEV